MIADPVLEAAAHIDAEMERWERLRAESACGDCHWCKRIFDGPWFSAEQGILAVCARDGLDWEERACRWIDEPCEDFWPREWA